MQKMERLNRRIESDAKTRYEDRYRRITIYLEIGIYEKLQVLRKQGFTQTAVINAALEEFLERENGLSSKGSYKV